MLLCVWFHASPVFTMNKIIQPSLLTAENLSPVGTVGHITGTVGHFKPLVTYKSTNLHLRRV